ncbi:MAG: hypothetical protein BJ554DRAFT_954, partial [Olpidium bornovanus]
MDSDEIYRCLVEQCQRLTTLPLRRNLRGANRHPTGEPDEEDGRPADVLIPDLFIPRLVPSFGSSHSRDFKIDEVALGNMSAINFFSLNPIDYRATQAAVKADSGWNQPARPSQAATIWGESDMAADEEQTDMVDDTKEMPGVALLVTGDVVVCEWPSAHVEYAFSEENRSVRDPWQAEQSATEGVGDGDPRRTEEDSEEIDPLARLFGSEKGRSLFVSRETVEPSEVRADRDEEERRRRSGVTLLDCFDEFMRTERLSEGNLWYCSDCKEHREANKSMGFWKLPDTLVVQLKRFAQSRTLRDKIDVMVNFDVDERHSGTLTTRAGFIPSSSTSPFGGQNRGQ